MWREALEAHESARVQVSEVRSSDYVGAGAFTVFTIMVGAPLLAGEPGVIPANLDAVRTWTCIDDVAALLVSLAQTERGWGRAWHVPANPPLSIREMAARFAAHAGITAYTLEAMSAEALAEAAATDAIMAELPEMQYLYQEPFILDSSETERVFGLEPSPLDDAIRAMVSLMTEEAQPV
jgi:nucleoside-diphosphate-sugar epimerase